MAPYFMGRRRFKRSRSIPGSDDDFFPATVGWIFCAVVYYSINRKVEYGAVNAVIREMRFDSLVIWRQTRGIFRRVINLSGSRGRALRGGN